MTTNPSSSLFYYSLGLFSHFSTMIHVENISSAKQPLLRRSPSTVILITEHLTLETRIFMYSLWMFTNVILFRYMSSNVLWTLFTSCLSSASMNGERLPVVPTYKIANCQKSNSFPSAISNELFRIKFRFEYVLIHLLPSLHTILHSVT